VALPAPPPEDLGVFDPAQQQLLRDRLCPMPAGTYLHEILFEHGGSAGLPRTYVEVTEPPYAPMLATYARIRADGSWKHRTLASGHDAMIISPGPLADLLLELAG
jgi:hypothetical protein